MSREDFSGYRLVERIGSGATATVFAAEYGELRCRVAIKILHRHLIGDEAERRMFAEARMLAQLDHPGIVKVFNMGVAADGRAYVVMEQLIGESLCARMRRARLTEPRVVMFARQLASALEVAHTAGVVHRDLKPENVLVVQDPELPGGERAKLLDFGIAKRTGQEQTATGVVLGTPAYMAPEQFRGTRHVDRRADIYSLGVILYVMATGKPPFAGDNTGELLAEHAYCQPTPASRMGAVSRRLSAIIDRCLAKRPQDRFATMAELGAALRALPARFAAGTASDTGGSEIIDCTTAVRGELVLDIDSPGSELDDAPTTVMPLPETFGADPTSCLLPVAPARAPVPPPARLTRRVAR
jgi:serine/threonine-protein kinase